MTTNELITTFTGKLNSPLPNTHCYTEGVSKSLGVTYYIKNKGLLEMIRRNGLLSVTEITDRELLAIRDNLFATKNISAVISLIDSVALNENQENKVTRKLYKIFEFNIYSFLEKLIGGTISSFKEERE